MARRVFSVAQVNHYVKRLLDSDALLAGIFVEGELSNFNVHSSGHMYFTLKDSDAAISGIMFKSHAANLVFEPQNGMKVIVFGQLSLYEKTGQYQLFSEFFEPVGIGGLQLAFRQLSEKLQNEGLFDEIHKRPLPKFAKTIAVITSPTGAAIHDITRTIQERNPSAKIIIAPAKVQGIGAASSLADAIKHVNNSTNADVIIIGRGGGSIEDLWAFNEEILARAIFLSKKPIISAVGHESDFTIADFVADYRAATPTAAAVAAAFDHAQVTAYVKHLRTLLQESLIQNLNAHKEDLSELKANLSQSIQGRITRERQNLAHQQILLEKVSPYTAFKRGYALVRANDNIIDNASALIAGQPLTIEWPDGVAQVTVDGVYTRVTTSREDT